VIKSSEYKQPVAIPCRKRGSRRPKLTVHEKINVVWQVVCQHIPVKEVAKEHRMTQSYVSSLVSKAKKNPRFLHELDLAEN